MPHKCRVCGKKVSRLNKTGYCKVCFGCFVLAPKGVAANSKRVEVEGLQK